MQGPKPPNSCQSEPLLVQRPAVNMSSQSKDVSAAG